MKTYLLRHTLNEKELKSFVVQGYKQAMQTLREWYARDIWAEDNECHKQIRSHSFRVASCSAVYKGSITRLKYYDH